MEEAHELFDQLCARTNPLGLLPKQIDLATGAFLGNFPQAFSHIGLISGAVNLAHLNEREEWMSVPQHRQQSVRGQRGV